MSSLIPRKLNIKTALDERYGETLYGCNTTLKTAEVKSKASNKVVV